MTPRTLKTSDVATMLSVSPATVRRLCDTGRLRFTKFCDGGRYRIFAESVEKLCGTKARVSRQAIEREAREVAAQHGRQGWKGVRGEIPFAI